MNDSCKEMFRTSTEKKEAVDLNHATESVSHGPHVRTFTDTFKTILSSVLKTDLGQVLKSRTGSDSKTCVGGTKAKDSSLSPYDNVCVKEENGKGNKKANTARKSMGKNPGRNEVSFQSGYDDNSTTRMANNKRRFRKFKGGTYELSITRKKYKKRRGQLDDLGALKSGNAELPMAMQCYEDSDNTNAEIDVTMSSQASSCSDVYDQYLESTGPRRSINEIRSFAAMPNISDDMLARKVISSNWRKSESKADPNTSFETEYFHKTSNGEFNGVYNPEMILCTCQENVSVSVVATTQKELFCQAVDCIDERLVGCCNVVTNAAIRRPARKVPFVSMCNVHSKRLRAHHCCPGCGLFCTQGMFMRCHLGPDHTTHLFHERCCVVRDGEALCPHCGGTSDWIHVRTRIEAAQPLTFYTKQQPFHKHPSARMTINRGPELLRPFERSALVPAPSYTIAETGKEISSDGLPLGPDRSQLEALLVNLSLVRPKNLRYTLKSYYNAAKSGDVEKILHMLAMSYDPNHKFEEHDNESLFHAACSSGSLVTVHLLQQAGAELDCFDNKLRTPLMAAVESWQHIIVRYLIRAGVHLEAKGEDGMTPLHVAAKVGNLEACRLLVESGKTNINIQDDGGWTPLVWAVEHRHKTVVQFLVQSGSDPNIRDNGVISCTTTFSDKRVTTKNKRLLEHNISLHWAAFSGSLEICELFLNRGCDLSSVNEHGDTPLHIAARQDNYDCIMLFLTRNADIATKNKEGETPIMCCPDESSQSWMALSMSRQLKHFARSCMVRSELVLHRDISCGKEANAVQCVNGVDDESFPVDYLYITENCETTPINVDRSITSLQSCVCEDDCATANCMCSSLSLKCWYTKEGSLISEFNLLDPPMIFECNRACRCWKNCNNRVVQHGIMSRLQLFRTKGKGWGVRTLRDIPQGTFICEYIGEMISDSEADHREDDSYLFDLDNRDGETYCIDARHYGNVSRFINHLCEPNLVPVKVFVDHQDLRFPRIAFFSSRDIKGFEELGFDYGEKFWIIKYKSFTCMCQSERCKYSSSKIQEMLENYSRRQREEVEL